MSPFPKCPVCSHPHAAGAKHKFDDEPAPLKFQGVEIVPDTIEQITGAVNHQGQEIRRGTPGMAVTGQASDLATVGSTKREDEASARQGSVPGQSSQPSQIFQGGNIEAKKAFDDTARAKYQRWFMRDQPKAKAEGMKVKAWRKKHSVNWREYPDE